MSPPFDPMLLETTDLASTVVERRGPAFAEAKLDGWRAMIEIVEDASSTLGRRARLWNRGGAEVTNKLPKLAAELALRYPAGTLLDGEYSTVDDRFGKVSSVLQCTDEKAQERQDAIRLSLFDMLAYDGSDMRQLGYEMRRMMLLRSFDAAPLARKLSEPLCRIVPSKPATDEVVAAYVAAGYEGAVIKLADSTYQEGARGRGWFRIKKAWTIDVVAMEFHAGEGERGRARKLGAIGYGQWRNGELIARGRCGGGFDDDVALDIWERQEELRGEVFELVHFGVVGEGEDAAPRHPQFSRWRIGEKRSEDCEWHDR